jgi:pSer/pThr/pTyr-binding forkhead associated (FHA) protein
MTSLQVARDLPRLVVTEPPRLRGEVFLLSGRSQVLGRGCHADFRLVGAHLRHSHAVLRRAGNQTVVADLGSTTGTALNGVSVSGPRLLRHGDVLRFAGVHLRYEDGTGGTVSDEVLRERAAERRRVCARLLAATVFLLCGVAAGIWVLLPHALT